MIEIRKILARETYAVRHPVLRAGKPLKTCHFDGDEYETTVHFGLLTKGKLVGVASIFEASSAYFESENQLQLRGMAVLEPHRMKGFGEALLRHSEKHAEARRCEILWFNARIIAVPFYERCGYQTIGDTFDIGDIGAHYVMYKKLALI